MDNKVLKIAIIILIVLIIIISVILAIIINNNNIVENKYSNIGDEGEKVDFSENTIKNVTEKIQYYTVKDCINSYLNALNKESSTYYIGNEYDEEMQADYVYNLLSKEYIQNNKLTKDNILNNVKIYEEKVIFTPIQMKVLEKENSNKYVSYGIISNLDNKYISDLYIIINLDLKNNTFEIEPLDIKYNSISDIELKNNNQNIEKNSYNTYIDISISLTNQYVVDEYLSLYKTLSLAKPEIIYNLMKQEYANKRFGTLQNFIQYINENKMYISKIKLKEYSVNNYDEYTEYVMKDQYDNLYIFNETEDMEYTIMLDTYTLEQEKFNEKYKNATNNEKVGMNITKFFQMINSKDYKAAYSVLSESFKNNKFKKEENFKQFINEKLYNYNDINLVNFSDEISGVFTYYVEVSNKENKDDTKIKMNIIMQLLENNEYRLSFEIID